MQKKQALLYKWIFIINCLILAVFFGVIVTSQADTTLITYLSPNAKPVADAGLNQTTYEESASIRLDASNSSDSDGDTIQFFWAELEDTADGCSLVDFTVAVPEVTILNRPEEYSCVFQVTVDDGRDESEPDEVVLYIDGDNDAPILPELADVTATSGSTVSFSFRTHDPENDAVTVEVVDTAGDFTQAGIALATLLNTQSSGVSEFRWLPESQHVGTYTLTISANDTKTTSEQTILITVNATDTTFAYSRGATNGKGIVTLFNVNGVELTQWMAFNSGGVTPIVVSNPKKTYIMTLRNKLNKKVKLYSTEGQLLEQVELPVAHWQIIGQTDVDDNSETVEVALYGKRKRNTTLALLQVSAVADDVQIVDQIKIKQLPAEHSYSLNTEAVRIIGNDGTDIYTWPIRL